MSKAIVRRGKLTIPLSAEIRENVDVRDGDELEVTSDGGRIVLTLVPEEPLPGELDALGEAEREFAAGKTRRLDDILHGTGRISTSRATSRRRF
jgi:bifunctional DNA-binding transcriptional regulator/antitoxin component of YhaV-PrlF toxin-antitoxin module